MNQDRDDGSDEGGLPEGGTRAYSAAMEAVVAIPIAMGLGWWADTKLGTSPWLLFLGLGFGFAAFVRRLVRMRKLVEQQARAASDDDDHRDD